MNDKTVNVLLIEDNPADADLIGEMLVEASGGSFDLECAGQLSSGLERLAEGDVDVILLDLALPDSRGLDTFASTHARAPQVPTVLLSSTDDEELAIEAMRQGAQDYLVKDGVNGHLLARTIRYAIERKQAETALWGSEQQLHTLFEEALNPILTVDEKGRYVDANLAALEFLECDKDKLLGKEVWDFSPHLPAGPLGAPATGARVENGSPGPWAGLDHPGGRG